MQETKDVEKNSPNEESKQQEIIDILKYFSRAEQICLAYGYGLFGVKKGDVRALKRYFKHNFDLKEFFIKTCKKKRLLTKPKESMTSLERAKYDLLISKEYKVLSESFFAGESKVTNVSQKESEHKEKENKRADDKSLIKSILLSKNIEKLTHIEPKIQYVLLAQYGVYGDVISLKDIGLSLGYAMSSINSYRKCGERYLKLLMSNPETLSEEEKEEYNNLIKNNYGVLSKEEFVTFFKTFKRKTSDNSNISFKQDGRRKTLVLPDYFDINDLVHFPIKKQMLMYLVFGLEGMKSYSYVKVSEAVKVGYSKLRINIDSILNQIKLLHTPIDKLSEEEKEIRENLLNYTYEKVTKDNLFELLPNKASEVYFEEKGM